MRIDVIVAILFLAVAAMAAPSPATAGDGASGGANGDVPAGAPAGPAAAGDIVRGLKSKEDAERLEAATAAADVPDDSLTAPLVRLLLDDRFEIRAAAIRALGARTSDRSKRDAARGLCARIPRLAKSAETEGELALVAGALHDLAQGASIDPLMEHVEDSTSEDVYRARLMAVANVPDGKAIDALIRHLARRGRGKWGGWKRDVIDALRYATGEELGGDPDAWRAWWHDAERTFDLAAAAERRAASREKAAERERRKREKREKRERKRNGGTSGGD